MILLDLALPDLDGRDVCQCLRRYSSVPIILVTASGTVTDRVVGLELGAGDHGAGTIRGTLILNSGELIVVTAATAEIRRRSAETLLVTERRTA